MDLDSAWGMAAHVAPPPVVSAMRATTEAPEAPPQDATHNDVIALLNEMDARRVAEARLQLVVMGVLSLIILHRVERRR